jgi:hypothetical protein
MIPHLTPLEKRQNTGQWNHDAQASDLATVGQDSLQSTAVGAHEEKDEWSDWDEQLEEDTEPFEFPPPPPPLPPVPTLAKPFSASYAGNVKKF